MGGSGSLTNALLPGRSLATKGSAKTKIWNTVAPGVTIFKGKGQPANNTSAPIVASPSDEAQKLREEKLTALRRRGNSSTILSSSVASDSAMSNETLGRRTLFYQ